MPRRLVLPDGTLRFQCVGCNWRYVRETTAIDCERDHQAVAAAHIARAEQRQQQLLEEPVQEVDFSE